MTRKTLYARALREQICLSLLQPMGYTKEEVDGISDVNILESILMLQQHFAICNDIRLYCLEF